MSTNNQYKFNEGEVHSFLINGFTEIPGTDEFFFILKNKFGGKHLLKSIHYNHYNLQVGETIKCRIDKINCSGKIYLEPENPKYKVEETYSFKIKTIIDQINSVGENEKAAVVIDDFGKEINCSLPTDFKIAPKQDKLNCKVLRIKKGELYISISEYKSENISKQIGKDYWFEISNIKKIKNNEDYYILKDENNNSYSLKVDMYKHYNFQINQKIKCTVTKFNTDGHLKIEPIHPHYIIGEVYSFNYLRTIEETDPLGNKEYVVIVKDILGVETKVRSQNIHSNKSFSETIQCRVDGIRKGKAILSFV